MHDRSLGMLEAVVDYYDQGGSPNPKPEREIKPLGLTGGERTDPVSFLHALGGNGWRHIVAPDTFPE